MKPCLLCLGNITNDFTVDNVKKNRICNRYVYNVSVDYNTLDVSDIACNTNI